MKKTATYCFSEEIVIYLIWEENIHIMLFGFSDTDEMIISAEVNRRAGRLKNAEEIYASLYD